MHVKKVWIIVLWIENYHCQRNRLASHPRPVTADHGVSEKSFLADTDISLVIWSMHRQQKEPMLAVTSCSVWGTHSYSWNFNGRSGHSQWMKCIVKSVFSAGHYESIWHWWKSFASKETTNMHIFDGYAKHYSANLVGCVETKQIRVTWFNSSSCNIKCLLWEMDLFLCTYLWCPQSWMQQVACDKPVLQTFTTMHSYYQGKYMTSRTLAALLSAEISLDHMYMYMWHVTHHVCTVEQSSGHRLRSWDSILWINDI